MNGYNNRSNFVPSAGEVFTKPSQTIPEQHISLREMLDRHLSGGSLRTYTPVYVDPNNPLPVNFERMSKIDRAQLLRDTADFVALSRGRIETSRMQRERLAAEEAAQMSATGSATPPAVVDPSDQSKPKASA